MRYPEIEEKEAKAQLMKDCAKAYAEASSWEEFVLKSTLLGYIATGKFNPFRLYYIKTNTKRFPLRCWFMSVLSGIIGFLLSLIIIAITVMLNASRASLVADIMTILVIIVPLSGVIGMNIYDMFKRRIKRISELVWPFEHSEKIILKIV